MPDPGLFLEPKLIARSGIKLSVQACASITSKEQAWVADSILNAQRCNADDVHLWSDLAKSFDVRKAGSDASFWL